MPEEPSDSSEADGIDATTAEAWAALGGRPALARGVTYSTAGDVLAARLPVRNMARATVGVCSLAAAELLATRDGTPDLPSVRVRESAVATAFVSERLSRVDGEEPVTFAPLSRFWRTADGWVRTHANYPHHRERLLRVLGIGDDPDPERVARLVAEELRTRSAVAVREAVYAGGGLAVAVAARPCLAPRPLVEFSRWGRPVPLGLPSARLPAEGVKVLDLTRVIAGPVGTRTLALLGADVLRVDAPWLEESPGAHADTGMGKRSASLDLASKAGRRTFRDLLGAADVVITGYRPGALEKFGVSAEAMLAEHEGLVVAELCAWGWDGPWAGRRGFDSLVQAASGIAAIESPGEGKPGALPAQALDHGTGYLLAAAVLRALTERAERGGGLARLSLAGTAYWLMHGIARTEPGKGSYDEGTWLAERPSALGALRYALPPVSYDGAPADWARPPTPWGGDDPVWRDQAVAI
ncbi:carnitine dehydratase [Prauserella marina]|uniref:CoA-transferase family III n=1 Tax=Prauserella marina TaxID=530584 RepID=A0A222VQM5_9PSEU|nr:CoA transferase [Prauserella marina]ASR36033.1 carnitine dehydratase [Prauserella marina]PWV84015.1 CoA transferase family III [Prauserella marina]SDC32444.1 CoA-transferase family III [Prauserella marina]